MYVPPHIKEMLLSHKGAKDPVEEIYDRWMYMEEKLEALQKWQDFLQTLLSKSEDTDGGRNIRDVRTA